MKRLIFILFVMAATMIFFNCSDNNPTSPESGQSDQVTLAKTKTDFTGTADIDCYWGGATNGTMKLLPNGDRHQRGVKAKYIMDVSEDLLNGEMYWATSKNIEADWFKAKLWGKIELVVTGGQGKWEFTWHGYKIGRLVTIDAKGVGVDGEVKGMVAKMTMEMFLMGIKNPTPGDGRPPFLVDECQKEFRLIEGYILK